MDCRVKFQAKSEAPAGSCTHGGCRTRLEECPINLGKPWSEQDLGQELAKR